MLVHTTPRADEFVALLRARLPERTFRHSVSVANLMAKAAEEAGVDPDDAVTAGLLHDMFKTTKGPELLKAADRYGLSVSPIQREKPMLLHGPVAAEDARRSLGVASEDVYDAIYWHTTGRPNYGRVGLVLYFADFSEQYRPMPEAAEARAKFKEEGFEAALLFVAKKKVEHVRGRYTIDPTTEAFYTWLTEELE